ncbi:hypothetical protein QBC37DRAFT_104763 [Rhypophila decipiens]|uniref:Uncharacterized protein n=1 Tax=Rhypophila decipiens TaxID=261697 RepID=A0AAN7AZC4_9PEZI|nr:hypothetical protein QBC37DRAFT_104763 [Rhypophila decipiens]
MSPSTPPPPMMATSIFSRDPTALSPDDEYKEPLSGMVISVMLSIISVAIISSFTTQRVLAVKTWGRLPFVQWLVFAIYTDSFMFVFATAILQFGFGVDHSMPVCEAAILLCLVCYVTTKILIYMFLVEKAHIIRSGNKKLRMRSKLYIFNSFGMIGVYCGVVVLNFIYRINRVENGQCIIGMQKLAMIPLIVFDLLVNVYLTVLFLIPLFGLYSFNNLQKSRGSRRLRTVATRTFIGCVCTLTSSIVNLSVLMALDGEPGWVCLMCCNSDILFSAVVIQWITSRDSMSPASNDSLSLSQARSYHPGDDAGGASPRRAGRHSNMGDLEVTTDSIHSNNGSPMMTPTSTKAIVDDVAEISLDNRDTADHPKCSTNTLCDDKRPTVTIADDLESGRSPRIPPPCVPARQSPTEVRVHVDYGSSLSHDPVREGIKLGNTIVIGSDSGRRGRSTSWRHGEGGS